MAALGLLVLYSVFGFFILPPWLRLQLEQRLAAATGRTVSVAKVRCNPWTLSLTVEGLDIRTRDGTGSFAGWTRLHVNFGALASLGGDWVLQEVALDGFRAAVAVEPDGTFDFTDILDRFRMEAPGGSAAAAGAAPRAVRVGRLGVKDSRLEFADRSRGQPFATTLGPLDFTVSDFRTVTRHGAPYHFAAVTEAGERLEWTGTIETQPFRSEGELKLEQILLPKYAAYYAARTGADLTNGRLTVRGRYAVNLAPDDGRVLRLRDGMMQLRDLRLAERRGGQELLVLPSLDVAGAVFDARTLAGSVGSIRAAGGKVAVRRAADGRLNWLALLPPAEAPADPAPAAPATAAAPAPSGAAELPDLRLGEFVLQDFQVAVEDLVPLRPAQLTLAGLTLSLRDISLAEGAVIPVETAFDWMPQGRVSVAGTVTLRPEPAAELKADLARFDLRPLSPYLEQHINARLTQGTVSASQTLRYRHGNPERSAEAGYEGSVWIDQLGLVDGERQEELAGFAALELNGIKAVLAPAPDLQVQEVVLSGPYARVEVREDRSVNIAALVRPAPSAAGAPVAAPGAAPRLAVGGVRIDGGGFSFRDRSLDPQVRVALEKFGGTLGALTSERPARAAVDLHGVVDGVGPVAVTGLLDPLGAKRFIDLQVGVRNVDLLPLSPYSGKYAGYELARGKLGLDVRARVEGSRLQADNVITLDQFTFGAAVDSPEATKLPVRLGVALLKDLDGRIVIDVPMSGDLADPDLRIGRVVLRVVVNLLTKAAVSPFALLGSMFGGGGDELAFQEFDPGADDLRDAARAKLDTMVQALRNRPGLSLGIEGSSDGPADTFALRHARLAALVRGQIWEERRAADASVPPPDRIVVSTEEHAAMVKRLFDARFPPGTEFGTPLPAAAAVVAPPPAPAGFLTGLVRALTFAAARERRAAERENAARAAAHAEAVAAAQAAGLPLEEMTGRLAETMEITPDDLRALAAARAARVRDYLVTAGGIAPERLFLTQPAAAAGNRGPRVFLTLQ